MLEEMAQSNTRAHGSQRGKTRPSQDGLSLPKPRGWKDKVHEFDVKCASCDRFAASGYVVCCRTCSRTGGTKHGPNCQQTVRETVHAANLRPVSSLKSCQEPPAGTPRTPRDGEAQPQEVFVVMEDKPQESGADDPDELEAKGDGSCDDGTVLQPKASYRMSSLRIMGLHDLKQAAQAHQFETACTKFVNGKFELFPIWGTSIAELGKFGEGVQLYFEFIRFMGVLFFVMFICSLPIIIFSYMGSFVSEVVVIDGSVAEDSWRALLARLSVVNLGACGNSSHCRDQDSRAHRSISSTDSTPLRDWTYLIALNDCIVTVIFYVGLIFFDCWKVKQVIAAVDEDNVTAVDFAVQVSGLPRRLDGETLDGKPKQHQYEELLSKHFEHLLKNVLKIAADERTPVVEVELIRGLNGAIEKFQKLSDYLRLRENCKVGESLGEMPPGRVEQEMARLDKKIQTLKGAIEKDDQPTNNRPVCGAFVIFEKEEYKEQLLKKYELNGSRWTRNLLGKEYEFEGHKLRLKQAPEPVDVIWENMDKEKSEIAPRRYFANMISLVSVLLCTLLVWYLRSVSIQVKPWVQPHKVWQFDSASCWGFIDLKLYANPDCTQELTEFSCEAAGLGATTCSQFRSCDPTRDGAHLFEAHFPQDTAVQCVEMTLSQDTEVETIQFGACSTLTKGQTCSIFHPLTLPEDDGVTGTGGRTMTIQQGTKMSSDCSKYDVTDSATVFLARELGLSRKDVVDQIAFNPHVACFCHARASQADGSQWLWLDSGTDEHDICSEWIDLTRSRIIKGGLGGLAVVLCNLLLLSLFNLVDRINVHPTKTRLAAGQMTNLWLSQVLITGVMVILASMNFSNTLDKIGIRSSGYYFDDFNVGWMFTIGCNYYLVLLGQAFSAATFGVFWIKVVDRFMRWFLSRGVFIQSILDDVYEFPEWIVSYRFSESLTIVSCVLMFSSIMPALYIIGFLYCLGAYWLDKWCLLRGSSAPPGLNAGMVNKALMICRGAGFVHLTLALWTFGDQEIVPSDWGQLHGAVQSFLGYSESDYNYTMGVYDTHGDVRGDYFSARLLDLGREANTIVLLLWIPSCIAIAINLIVLIFRPILKPFIDTYKFARKKTAESVEEVAARAITIVSSPSSSAAFSGSFLNKMWKPKLRSEATSESYREVTRPWRSRRSDLVDKPDEKDQGSLEPAPGEMNTKSMTSSQAESSAPPFSSTTSRGHLKEGTPATKRGFVMSYKMMWHPKYSRVWDAFNFHQDPDCSVAIRAFRGDAGSLSSGVSAGSSMARSPST
jgi:hypothetical protein